MPMAGDARNNVAAIRSLRSSAIAWTSKNGIKLAANHLFNQLANTAKNPGFDRVKPNCEWRSETMQKTATRLGTTKIYDLY